MSAIVFAIIITFLLLHEMDAIKAKEWKMFVLFGDLKEDLAYIIFSVVHLPLYFILVLWMIHFKENNTLFIVVDILMAAHTIVHFLFRKNKNNGFSSLYSKVIIYIIGLLSIIHICFILLK